MYTYLNQRYGLKNLIIEWAHAIIQGIKIYQKEDHDVALFGKILRNECDEEFRFIQHTVRETVVALLRAVIREKYPTKSEEVIQKLQETVIGDSIERWQWKKIIEKMYDEEDYKQLEQQILQKIHQHRNNFDDHEDEGRSMRSSQKSNTVRSSSSNNNVQPNQINKKLTRDQVQHLTAQEMNMKDKLKFGLFMKCVLDF